MENLIQSVELARVVIWILLVISSSLGMGLVWFLQTDRKKFMESLKSLDKKIEDCKDEVDAKIDSIMGDVENIKGNYNLKFQKVYDKQDEMVQRVNENHVELIRAIQSVELKIK